MPSDGWEWGFLRVVTRADGEADAKPGKDLRCLLADDGEEGHQALLMAAAATAHVWAPRAADGAAPDAARGSRGWLGWLGTARSAVARIGAALPEAGERPAERDPADTAWIYEQIERLGDLRSRGLLTDEEFSAKKAELLARI